MGLTEATTHRRAAHDTHASPRPMRNRRTRGPTIRVPTGNHEKDKGHTPYRVLVVAEKYQTGCDQPLLHTMCVDKKRIRAAARSALCFTRKNCGAALGHPRKRPENGVFPVMAGVSGFPRRRHWGRIRRSRARICCTGAAPGEGQRRIRRRRLRWRTLARASDAPRIDPRTRRSSEMLPAARACGSRRRLPVRDVRGELLDASTNNGSKCLSRRPESNRGLPLYESGALPN